MQAQVNAIQAKVAQCIAAAEAKFGIKMPEVTVRCDLRGRAAGVAGYTINRATGETSGFYLRFNRAHMALGGKTWEHLLNDTVPHEVAHSVCQAFPRLGSGHDAGWQRVCLALGGNGRTRYSEEDAPEAIAAARPYVYITTAGNTVRVTKVIHNKIQRLGMSYTYKGGLGKINRQCQYNYATAPAVASSTKPVVVAQPATAPVQRTTAPTVAAPVQRTTGVTNASLVRARIAQAKARAEAPAVVVQWAADTLGMKVALAKAYVKNNWDKV